MRHGLVAVSLAALALTRCNCFEAVAEGGPSDGGDALASDAALPLREDAALAPGPDAAAPPDAGTLDASACQQANPWRYEERRLASIELFEGIARLGTTERLLVKTIAQADCERPARVDVEVMPGDATDFVRLTAHVWARDGSCAPSTAPVIVQIPGRGGDNLNVSVGDALEPSGASLHYGRSCPSFSGCLCLPTEPSGTVPRGQACTTDCDCAWSLRCIGGHGYGGPQWTCEVPCVDGSECEPGERCIGDIADAARYVCRASACGEDLPCPEGFECTAKGCEDRRMNGWEPSCLCDEDCGPGGHCTLTPRGYASCEVWCSEGMQCPYHLSVFVCATPSICVPLD